MARVVTIPAETDVLCERCGYVLNGLPPGANCPECGHSTAESAPELRQPSAWEQAQGLGGRVKAFFRTTADAIFRTKPFFRHLSVSPHQSSRVFAHFHWFFTSALFGAAMWMHLGWFWPIPDIVPAWAWRLGIIPLVGAAYGATIALNWLAARLTAWEAAYRGIRLPLPVVRRGLDYHAAHYWPLALVLPATVLAYQIAARQWPYAAGRYADKYLYVLCGEVILGAGYLFQSYWAAMRNLMYANR